MAVIMASLLLLLLSLSEVAIAYYNTGHLRIHYYSHLFPPPPRNPHEGMRHSDVWRFVGFNAAWARLGPDPFVKMTLQSTPCGKSVVITTGRLARESQYMHTCMLYGPVPPYQLDMTTSTSQALSCRRCDRICSRSSLQAAVPIKMINIKVPREWAFSDSGDHQI